ncbi:MAG: hypothetical protein Q9213_008046 [Squamulea squamosa]
MAEPTSLRHTSYISWDMQLSSRQYFPCFRFISDRLAQCKLHVILILAPNEPFFIPVCPMSRAAESRVIRIFRRACDLFPTVPDWITQIALRSASRNSLDRLEARPSDAYLVRRSLIQHEIIFSDEGLTLLSADHIHAFKHQLSHLSKPSFLHQDYTSRMDSCVQLLRRINDTYRGVKLSKPYLERAYDIELRHSTLREVCKAYTCTFGEAGVREVSLAIDGEVPQLPELESPTDERPAYLPAELESPTSQRFTGTPSAIDARTRTAETACEPDQENSDDDVCDIDMGSPNDYLGIGVTYPKIPSLTKLSGLTPLSTQSSLDTITTTICSRCLAYMHSQETNCGQEMQMLMGPEWEDFRRVGLGILRC